MKTYFLKHPSRTATLNLADRPFWIQHTFR